MRGIAHKGRREADMLMTARQCRAARAGLGWSQDDLANRAGLSRAVVTDFERGKRDTLPMALNALMDALEGGGVEFSPRSALREVVSFDRDHVTGGG
jgi:transcriptional regulator with XRE-family HTH domain